ncbi:Transcription-associated protein 1, partial [Neolecta irregularis DAH-3]
MLKLQPSPQADAHTAAEAIGDIHIGVAPSIRNKQLFGEFIVVQVKTMSFLAYIIRSLSLREHQDLIPGFVVRLLKDCPIDMSPTRKELLVATRHILSTEYRAAFVEHIDVLLSEKVLIGCGVTAHETLRPLAYSMLADLLHHIREKLDFSQLRKTIQVYSCNLHDSTLAPGIQTMCAKLLLNLIDRIMKLEASQGRELLVMILQTFTKRFVALNREFLKISSLRKDTKRKEDAADMNPYSSNSCILSEIPSKPIRLLLDVSEHETDALKDGRFLFKNLMLGFKTVLFGLKSCNPAPPTNLTITPQQWNDFARGLAAEEINIFSELFREGLQAF